MNTHALSRYLIEAAARPFRLGEHDCVSFAFEAVKVGWDRDYTACLGYSDRRSAVDRLREAEGLHEAICEGLGEDLPMSELQPGDLAWFGGSMIGVIMPGYVAVKAYRTIVRMPMEHALSGWKT